MTRLARAARPTSSCTCSRRDSISAFFASSSACAAAVWAPIASRVRTADCSSAARIAASRSIIDWARASSSSWRVCSGSGAGDRRSNVTMPTATTTRAATATMPAAMTSAVMCSSWRGGVTFPGDHPCSPRSERVREHFGELVSGLGDHHAGSCGGSTEAPRAPCTEPSRGPVPTWRRRRSPLPGTPRVSARRRDPRRRGGRTPDRRLRCSRSR